MQQTQVDKAVSRAIDICAHSGGRLTEKRKNILALLLASDTPMSAYELAEQFNKTYEQSMPPMSAYRILDFLLAENLVHKLSSANKFIACAHITCSHSHEVPQFLICRHCHKVKEISIKKNIIEHLRESVQSGGYVLMNSQIELDCLCKACSKVSLKTIKNN